MTITFSSSDPKRPTLSGETTPAAEAGDSRDGIIRLKRRRTRRSLSGDSGVCVILLGPDSPRQPSTKAERWTKKVVDRVTTAGTASLVKEGAADASDPRRWYAFDDERAGIHLAV